MNSVIRTALAMLVVTVLAAGAAGWLGVHYGLAQARSTTSLDRLLHHELDLSDKQERDLASLEAAYAARRKVLEEQARAANRELAGAILTEHRYGPKAQAAIDHFHAAMKTLEQATIMHVLTMRSVLTPAQAQLFDQTVAKALDSAQP